MERAARARGRHGQLGRYRPIRVRPPRSHGGPRTHQALRQVLNRAVAWKLIERQPGQARAESRPALPEQRPFESWEQIRSLAERLGLTFGPMVLFAAATGLRPSELFALEHGNIDRAAGVVQIRRAYANGRVKHTKTRLSRRAVPLQALAVDALDQLRPRCSRRSCSPSMTSTRSVVGARDRAFAAGADRLGQRPRPRGRSSPWSRSSGSSTRRPEPPGRRPDYLTALKALTSPAP